jgi:hypothetical protein
MSAVATHLLMDTASLNRPGHQRGAAAPYPNRVRSSVASAVPLYVIACRHVRPRVRLNKLQAAAVRDWIEATADGRCRPATRLAASTATVCPADAAATDKQQ